MIVSSQVYAQEPVETPEFPVVEGYVFKWRNDVVFPEGVRFFLTVSRPVKDLVDATLVIEPVGLSPITVNINLEEPVATGPSFTDLDYVWEFPEGFAPRLFQSGDVIFEWQTRDTNNDIARVRDTLLFTDSRFEWEQSEDPQGRVDLVVPSGGPTARQIRSSIEQPYDLLAANVGAIEPLNVILYPADVNPNGCEIALVQLPAAEGEEPVEEERVVAFGPRREVWLPCDPAQAARVFAASDSNVVQSWGSTLNGFQAALNEFLVGRFYGPVWMGADVPGWFVDGLRQFYQPSNKAHLLLAVQDAARTNRLLSLDEMGVASPDDLWRAQSYAMVLHIAHQIGVDALFELANVLQGAESFPAAYENVVGQPLEALMPEIRRWIFTNAAISAFNYTPYQAETPTPTASLTATPFPPTSTNTPTVTATATLTPSVTGVLSPTPTLTPPPSRTPTPRPPTVTPRPAGSLFTPTPVPAPSLLDNPVNRLGVIVILLIVLAIIVLVYWISGRRNDEFV